MCAVALYYICKQRTTRKQNIKGTIMEKHVQIALANAQAALAFIDPWAKVVAIKDVVKYNAVLAELCEKYNFTGDDVIHHDDTEISCFVDMRLVVSNELDDFMCCYEYQPEFDLLTPRQYNEEFNQYSLHFELDAKAIHACSYMEGRQTPYTVETICERRTNDMIKLRMERLEILDAPAIIKLNEELKYRQDEYMVRV